MCFANPTPDWANVALRAKKPLGLLIRAAEGLAAAFHARDFQDSEALET